MKRFSAFLKRRVQARPVLLLSSVSLGLLALSTPGHASPTDDANPTTGAIRPAPVLPRGALPAPPDAANAKQALIGQIIVLGNRTLSQTAIILMSGHKEGDPCTPQTLDEMRANLVQKGLFGLHSADLEDAVKIHAEPNALPGGACKVVIELDENDVVAGINITGSGPIKPTEIRPLLHLNLGVVYNPLQFRRDYLDIQQLYNRRGYAVTPSQDAGFDEKGILNVALNVARVTEIKIEGNHRTRARAILREMQTRINGYFNSQTLEQDRLRLLKLGVFEGADGVEIVPHDLGSGKIGVTVRVKEQKTAAVLGGFSYSQRDQLVGEASISDNNFRGMAESLSLSASLGATTGRHSVALDYRRPWLDNHETGLDIGIYDKSVARFADSLYNAGSTAIGPQGGNYYQQHTGGSVTLSRPLGQRLRAALTFRGEETRTDPIGLTGVNASIMQDGPLYVLGGTLLHDTRDYIPDPARGSYQNLILSVGHDSLQPVGSLGVANPLVFGTHNYGKSSLDYRQFWSLFGPPRKPGADRTTLAWRLLGGSSVGRLPFSEQYFLGGGDTLRGYRDDRFWGSNLLLSSLELRQPIARRFKAVAFVDVGEAWGGDYTNVNIAGFGQSAFQPHVGTGIGLRVGTPLGQIRIDIGYGDEGTRTHFGFGGSF
jgi:outer membrane protein insertion porin family